MSVRTSHLWAASVSGRSVSRTWDGGRPETEAAQMGVSGPDFVGPVPP